MACEGLMKGFLVALNALFFVIGAATLAVGIWVKVDKKHLLDLAKDFSGTDLQQTDVPSLLENAVTVLITAGAFLFLLAFLGCCGTVQNKSQVGKLFLKLYSSIILVVLIMELAGVTVAWFFFDKVESKLKEYLDASLQSRYNGSFTASFEDAGFLYSSGGDTITLAWDIVQLQYECCGRVNGQDYTNNSLLWDDYRYVQLASGATKKFTVPPTCCKVSGGSKALVADFKKIESSTPEFELEDPECPYSPADTSVGGCYETLKDVIKDNSVIFIAIGLTAIGVQILCIVFSCCLAKRDNDIVEDHIVNKEDDGS